MGRKTREVEDMQRELRLIVNAKLQASREEKKRLAKGPHLTVFRVIETLGHDEDFFPERNVRRGLTPAPEPTDHAPGSEGKIAELSKRVLLGQPLWVEGDRQNCEGLTEEQVAKVIKLFSRAVVEPKRFTPAPVDDEF